MSEARRTAFALAAVEFANYFDEQFGELRIGSTTPYRPELAVPQGMSTAGGAQALQHIVLQPSRQGVAPLTVGWVNRRGWTAQIRSFACLDEMHRQRFPNRRFDLDAASYQSFLARAQTFLEGQGMTVQIELNAPAPLSGRPSPGGNQNQGIVVMILGILVGFIGVGIALYVALSRK
ncbi:MAG: hypothetical protein ABI193_24315 [Minicystis sp.]